MILDVTVNKCQKSSFLQVAKQIFQLQLPLQPHQCYSIDAIAASGIKYFCGCIHLAQFSVNQQANKLFQQL